MRNRTGARGLLRRSSGGGIADQSDSSGRIGARIGPRLYLALLGVVSVAACFLPLADHLGYELSELVALAAGIFGGIPGVAAARIERDSSARALSRGLWFSLWALAIPVGVILLNGLRRPVCDPLGGFALYLALAVPSATLACTLGVACGFVKPRRAGWVYAAIFAGSLAIALWPVARGPQVFVFHHLSGMYPGPLYDEAIATSRALWLFRGDTMLYAAACAGIALIAGPPRSRRRGIAILAVAGGGALWLSLQAEKLHWKASAAQIEAELGGRIETEHLVLHFPREKKDEERALLARDAEIDVRAVARFLGIQPGPRIDVYLYRSAEEKRTLLGAAETSFTKPWLHQIHTNDAPAPHPILRHELVHAIGAQIARGIWKVPGGLVPQMALTEGVAVAGDWPPGEFTVHEEARAMRELNLLPDLQRLFRPAAFYAEAGPRAYTAAGSFLRFMRDRRGPELFSKLYSSLESIDPGELVPEYLRFLEGLQVPDRALALAAQRYSAPGIGRKRCPHEVAALQREAQRVQDPHRAAELWARCAAMEPGDPALLVALRRAQLAAKDPAAAEATEAKALAHPKLSAPLRAQLLTDSGDAAWKTGDVSKAYARYTEAAKLPQPEAAERGLAVRLKAVRDPESWPALRPLLAESNPAPEILLHLRDLDLSRPRDGLAAYLLAKQMQNRAAWQECAAFAASALRRELPGPLFLQEALRMRGIAAWHVGDDAAARAAFTALGKNAPPGRAVEVERWLDRLR